MGPLCLDVWASAVNCCCAHIYFKCASICYHLLKYIYMCVCVRACVRVDRKRFTRLENMHIYTSSTFIVAVYMGYQVCIYIYIYICVCVCVRACALTVKG